MNADKGVVAPYFTHQNYIMTEKSLSCTRLSVVFWSLKNLLHADDEILYTWLLEFDLFFFSMVVDHYFELFILFIVN